MTFRHLGRMLPIRSDLALLYFVIGPRHFTDIGGNYTFKSVLCHFRYILALNWHIDLIFNPLLSMCVPFSAPCLHRIGEPTRFHRIIDWFMLLRTSIWKIHFQLLHGLLLMIDHLHIYHCLCMCQNNNRCSAVTCTMYTVHAWVQVPNACTKSPIFRSVSCFLRPRFPQLFKWCAKIKGGHVDFRLRKSHHWSLLMHKRWTGILSFCMQITNPATSHHVTVQERSTSSR